MPSRTSRGSALKAGKRWAWSPCRARDGAPCSPSSC
jgi:hypothetical protein